MIDNKLASDYLRTAFADKQRIIALADGKANILLGIIGIILSIFFGLLGSDKSNFNLNVMLILIPFVISGACAIFTVIPRTPKPSNMASLLYFKDTAKLDKKSIDYVAKFEPEKIYEDYITNMKVLSTIIEKKLRYLRYSYFFLALGVILKLVFEFMQWV